MNILLRVILLLSVQTSVSACIWDAVTLSSEKSRSHDLAETILVKPTVSEDPQKLRERLRTLEANPDENKADWWNNRAGAYIRLGNIGKAAALLESVVAKFPDDYGIHANLGTAYHLLGRYPEAEKEIAQDLKINPDAHFGLEKYHLALLQYLIRDTNYQSRHLYVDEFTGTFLTTIYGQFYFYEAPLEAATNDGTNLVDLEAQYRLEKTNRDQHVAMQLLTALASTDAPPGYRTNWDLGVDTNFEAGVIYMAQMNPAEPACAEMLGIAAWKKHNYHLAITAFQNAITRGSLKSAILKHKIEAIQDFIKESNANTMPLKFTVGIVPITAALFLIYLLVRLLIKSVKHSK